MSHVASTRGFARKRTALASCKTLEEKKSPCVLDGWARGEREGYGGPRDVTSLSLSKEHKGPRGGGPAAYDVYLEVQQDKLPTPTAATENQQQSPRTTRSMSP